MEKAMRDLSFDYDIRSGWRGRVETPAAIGEKFLKTLDALSAIDPVLFANWQLTDLRAMSSLTLEEARPRVVALIEKNVVRDDFRKPSPIYGYHAVASVGQFKDPRKVRMDVDAGGKFDGGTLLDFGEWDVPPDPVIITFPLFKSALLAINAIWQPPFAWACAYESDYWEQPLRFPYSRFHMTWLGYLSAHLADGVQMPLEIKSERTPDGGLLMIAAEQRLDPTNPEHWQRARILAEIMVSRTGEKFSTPARFIDLSKNPPQP
jgi:immunity protein 52 of polymorphic toxin system